MNYAWDVLTLGINSVCFAKIEIRLQFIAFKSKLVNNDFHSENEATNDSDIPGNNHKKW